MDPQAIRERLAVRNDIYGLVAAAAGYQSAFTVDKQSAFVMYELSCKLQAALPALIAGLAAEVEQENAERT